jgi:hypothetical protein
MTAEAFAALLNARHTGSGKWQARCPAHADRSPSLSIAEGRDGRVLLHCFAGCTADAVLAALELSSRDLFQGRPPSPEEARRIANDRIAREKQNREQRQRQRAAADRVRRLGAVCTAIAERLARIPEGAEGDAMAALFHSTLDKLRSAQSSLEAA